MTALRPVLCVLLSALLVLAQHAAVAHAIWHAHERLTGHAHEAHAESTGNDHRHGRDHADDGDHDHSTQSRLCDFDLAFGEVLGAIAGQGPAPVGSRIDTGARRPAADSCRRIATVPPQSRGPPPLS